jgi:hypothetical protein
MSRLVLPLEFVDVEIPKIRVSGQAQRVFGHWTFLVGYWTFP